LTPDLQASRIANVMLSATAPPCAYSPSPTTSLPYFTPSIRKRGINSIEVEMDESNKKRREKIMRMMEKGSSSKAKETIVGSSTHAPTFARMAFVERWRASKDEQRAAPKKKSKKKKVVEEEGQEAKDASPPAPAPAAKKKSKKKTAQKDKDQAEREQAEREAAAAAAAKVKEEETTKKSKKGKKKDQAAQQQQAQQQAAQAQAMALVQVQALAQAQADAAEAESNKKSGKKTTKLKKAKIQPNPAANSSNPPEMQQQQQPYGGAPPPQMYQQMLNYQAQAMNQGSPANGLSAASYPGLFAGNINGGGLALPGQAGNYTNVQQQIQQAAARGLQQQPGMNGNFMMNPQMQQHLQALAAMQQQNMSHSPQSMPSSQPLQQGQFNSQDNALPVGVGLGNLPPNWNTMA
jgi:transcription factor SPT20